MAVLYLSVTSRWGSHVGVPGLPLYIGDLTLAAALMQALRVVRRANLRWRSVIQAVSTAPLALLLSMTLLGWAAVRTVIGLPTLMSDPLNGLRDLAPYGYAVAGLVAFVLPNRDGPRQRRWVYGILWAHVAWVVGAILVPGWPGVSLRLDEAVVLVPRPDFDAAICGAALALALYDVLHGRRGKSAPEWTAGLVFVVANSFALASLLTRAGLLAGLLGVLVVGLTWGLPGLRSRDVLIKREGAAVVAVLVLLSLAAVSPPGQRLVSSVTGSDSQSQGTLQARQFTWSGVSRYVLANPVRTAVGVGFGTDFLANSGTVTALEGDEYENVRSPHNYLIGTFARLGVFGSLIAGLLILAAGVLASRTLARPTGTVTAFAAVLVLVLPVTALLGVVLESPFGAIPYFWAVGHLARCAWEADQQPAAGQPASGRAWNQE